MTLYGYSRDTLTGLWHKINLYTDEVVACLTEEEFLDEMGLSL